mmetsp:Transcript_10257/g.19680  ORF Transcript_10257/g.19680 Transcript_10257/m.19680 type:complete len:238 (+) Transcript_10257:288-1001(+)
MSHGRTTANIQHEIPYIPKHSVARCCSSRQGTGCPLSSATRQGGRTQSQQPGQNAIRCRCGSWTLQGGAVLGTTYRRRPRECHKFRGLDGLARGLLSWRPTGRAVLVQELGADVNARGGCRQDTPLHVACHYGGGTHGWEIVKFLVQQAGADVTAKNYRQHTPIDEIPMERENRRYANREDFEADMAYLERNMQIYTFLEEWVLERNQRNQQIYNFLQEWVHQLDGLSANRRKHDDE